MAITLAAGSDHVVVDPRRGGRITSFVAAGAQRLVAAPPAGAPASLAPLQWGSFAMAPWAGRIRDGRLVWDGETYGLEQNLEGHAIHGVVFDEPWRVVERADDRVVLACSFDPERWPLRGEVEQSVHLTSGRLQVVLTVTAGRRRMPAWMGWHTCFRRPEHGDVRLRIPADEVLVTDDTTVPTGRRRPVAGDLDLRDTPPLGPRRLDDTFVRPSGPLAIRWPDLALDMDVEPSPACAVVFTPAHEFCVEAQTGFPDAVRLATAGDHDTGVADLAPGESVTATNTWTWTPITPEEQHT